MDNFKSKIFKALAFIRFNIAAAKTSQLARTSRKHGGMGWPDLIKWVESLNPICEHLYSWSFINTN